MSRLAGLWNLDGRPVDRDVLERLDATPGQWTRQREHQWLDGAMGVVCGVFPAASGAVAQRPLAVHRSGAVALFDGRLDNREQLFERLTGSDQMPDDADDAAVVVAAYCRFGDRLPEHLLGDFALAVFDPTRQQLLLARDAIGMRPLYYCRTPSALLFGSAISAILAHPQAVRRPNRETVEAFLAPGGAPRAGATCFENVMSLPPAHLARVTRGGMTVERYWDFDPGRRVRLGSFAEYTDAFRHVFEQAVRRRLRAPGPVACFVSGGLDSASVFGVARALGRGEAARVSPVFGLTLISRDGLTSRESDERRFLLEIERRERVQLARVPFDTADFVGACRRAVVAVEAPFLDTHWFGNVVHRGLHSAAARGARVVMTGDWSEQVFGGQAYLVDLFQRLAWRSVWAHLGAAARWSNDADAATYRRVFLRDLARRSVPAPMRSAFHAIGAVLPPGRPRLFRRDRWRDATASAPSPPAGPRDATAHAQYIYGAVRSDYKAALLEAGSKLAAAAEVETAYPFLDRELVSFLMGVPGAILHREGVPRAMLRAAVVDHVPPPIVRRRWSIDAPDFVDGGLVRDLPRVTALLDPQGMVVEHGYATAEEITRARQDALATLGAGFVPVRLGRLIAVELWLDAFFGVGREEAVGEETRGERTLWNGMMTRR